MIADVTAEPSEEKSETCAQQSCPFLPICKAASIDDQVRVCCERIEREGWTYLHAYCDRAMSGTSQLRPGYQKLLEDARHRLFDVVVAEALDRLSRDQEHVAHLYKQLTFFGIKLVTLSEGPISELHVGLSGTMGAREAARREDASGLAWPSRVGRSGGGNPMATRLCGRREPTVRWRSASVNPLEAEVVRRIYRAYALGEAPRRSPRRSSGRAGPSGGTWGIHHQRECQLNNDLYVGMRGTASVCEEPQHRQAPVAVQSS
jgi:hypothetical protein